MSADALLVWLKKPRLQAALALLSSAGLLISLALVFLLVPTEAVMGAVQKVFYFHLASVFAAYAALALLLFFSAFYLAERRADWDELSDAAAAVALLFCTIALFSGMIWGHSAWNTWWSWEPRLVSFLVLWLMLGSYRILRWYSRGNERERSFAAVLGILCALNAPIVIFSIRLNADAAQLHPQVVARGGLRDLPHAMLSLGVCTFSLIVFSLWLLVLFFHQRNLQRRMREIEYAT